MGLMQPTYAIYTATKAAVEAMTHILSKELRGRNVTVNRRCSRPHCDGFVFERQVAGAR